MSFNILDTLEWYVANRNPCSFYRLLRFSSFYCMEYDCDRCVAKHYKAKRSLTETTEE